jgi:hypothetical protein
MRFLVDKATLGQVSPSTSVSLAKHYTECFTLIIIHGWYNRPAVASVIVDSVPLHPHTKLKPMV